MKTVSVIVPCRNEAGFVEAFCASALGQSLPADRHMELIIADGMSDDGTRDILQRLAQRDDRVRVVDNPGRIVSTGLNRALALARGDVIVRMDVHTTYADDYVAQCLEALARTGADNVGGPWHAQGVGGWSDAIATAFQSRWVSGGALSRDLTYEGPVDTAYLGAWPRSTFVRFGEFDENLVRNQDDEHNLRITAAQGKVWQSARIRSTYRPRGSVRALYRQWSQYGYWKPFVMRKHRQPAAIRQLIPGIFVGLAVVLTLAAALGASWLLPLALMLAYAAAVLALTLAAAGAAGRWSAGLVARLPVVIAAHHMGYGVGTWVGWWDVLRGRSGRPAFGRLTR